MKQQVVEEDHEEEEDNVLDIIHPISEGKDTSHPYTGGEPEYKTMQGHKFAMLDWGLDEYQPAVAQ